MPRDRWQNTGRGEMVMVDAEGNYIDAENKVVALLGVKDLIIVDTPDALLIADRNRAQQVGDLVKLIEAQGKHELL